MFEPGGGFVGFDYLISSEFGIAPIIYLATGVD
jgi:hypothetical protein